MRGRNSEPTKKINALVGRLREVLTRCIAAGAERAGEVWLYSADMKFLFGISSRTLDHWKKDGLIRPQLLGGRNRFGLPAVLELIQRTRHLGTVKKGSPFPEQELDPERLVLLDSNDFCSYLKISSRTEFRYRSKALLPHIRIRGRIYYTMADIREMMEKFRKVKS